MPAAVRMLAHQGAARTAAAATSSTAGAAHPVRQADAHHAGDAHRSRHQRQRAEDVWEAGHQALLLQRREAAPRFTVVQSPHEQAGHAAEVAAQE